MMCATPLFAVGAKDKEKTEFNRHWFMQVQAGAAYTLGETGFGDLLSPAAALSAGYRFSPVWGLRFGLGGWQAKGAWVSPEMHYKFNYLQGNVEAMLDLANLFGRFNPVRTVNPYLFAGVGVSGAFNNDEANAICDKGYAMENVWSGGKVFVAGRLGAGLNFRLSDCVLLGVEVNADMLSDKFNSKKAGNVDWQFNALAGLTFRFGKTYRKKAAAVPSAPVAPAAPAEPAPEQPAPEPRPEPAPAPAPVPVAEKPVPLREDIFFRIGSSEIRASERPKVEALADYLRAHPETTVSVTGYADAATGGKARNLQLSMLRAAGVSEALQQAGIAADRIRVDYKGDSEQPFATAAENRVSVCVAQ